MASEEWVSDYLHSRERNGHIKTAELPPTQVAQIRAPGFFESLLRKVASDVRAFNSYRGNGLITFRLLDQVPGEEYTKWTGFLVAKRQQYPFVSLMVKLRDIFIDYEICVIKSANEKETLRGSFKIIADQQGRVRTIRDGEPYCDVSEVSEFLLRPVFDCVDISTLSW